MTSVYDYVNNVLNYTSKDGVQYRLQLRGFVTIVEGESSTGKSYLVSELFNLKSVQVEVSGYDVSNIFIPSTKKDWFSLPSDYEGLTIIDRADILLTDIVCEQIKNYRKMRFLLFLRKAMNIGYSPNYFGEFVNDNGVIVIKYKFSEELWF